MQEEIYVSFELTMPVRKSWNGQWAGDWTGVNIRHFMMKIGTTPQEINKLEHLLKNSPYFYYFKDGWQAQVNIELITSQREAKRRAKRSNFCGYAWMVESLLLYGQIISVRQAPGLSHLLKPHFITPKINTNGKGTRRQERKSRARS